MILTGALLAAASAAPGAASVAPAAQVALHERVIRVRDVVRDSGLTTKERGRVIARLPAGAASVMLPRRAVAALVHRAVPRLTFATTSGVTVFRLAPTKAPARACLALARPLARGAAIGAADVAPAACKNATAIPARFAAGAWRATADLALGTYLGPVRLAASPGVRKGTALQLISTAGPVRIVRPVTAMQDGHDGGRVFVRDADGDVFAAAVQAGGDSE